MSKTQRVCRGMSVVGLAACAVCLPAAASTAGEPTPPNKAQIEYLERQSQPSPHPPKAQIEYDERQAAVTTQETGEGASVSEELPGNTVGWHLALSAAAGAAVTAAVVAGTQQVRRHHSVVA